MNLRRARRPAIPGTVMDPPGNAAATRPWVILATILVAAGGACSVPPPRASNAVPPPASSADSPIVWAALGGERPTSGPSSEDPVEPWTQLVLARLPTSAQLVDVTAMSASGRTGLSDQLGVLEATQVRPTVASVWVTAAKPGTGTAQHRAELSAAVDRLRALGVGRIVLISSGGGMDTDLVRELADAHGASIVDLGMRPDPPPSGGGTAPAADQAAIADAVTPAIQR